MVGIILSLLVIGIASVVAYTGINRYANYKQRKLELDHELNKLYSSENNLFK